METSIQSSKFAHKTPLSNVQQYQDAESDICQHFGITVFPTVIFFKNSQVIWMAHGSAGMINDMTEGLLYFSESPKLRSREHVVEMTAADEYHAFMRGEIAPKGAHQCTTIKMSADQLDCDFSAGMSGMYHDRRKSPRPVRALLYLFVIAAAG